MIESTQEGDRPEPAQLTSVKAAIRARVPLIHIRTPDVPRWLQVITVLLDRTKAYQLTSSRASGAGSTSESPQGGPTPERLIWDRLMGLNPPPQLGKNLDSLFVLLPRVTWTSTLELDLLALAERPELPGGRLEAVVIIDELPQPPRVAPACWQVVDSGLTPEEVAYEVERFNREVVGGTGRTTGLPLRHAAYEGLTTFQLQQVLPAAYVLARTLKREAVHCLVDAVAAYPAPEWASNEPPLASAHGRWPPG